MARLVWLHVPLRLTCTTDDKPQSETEKLCVMREKRLALDLLAG